MALTTDAQRILNSAEGQAGAGIPEPFWQIVERYRGELVNQAYAILNHVSDAEDVVQETFCEAFQQPHKLQGLRSLGAYLRAINKRNALDRLRQGRREADRAERQEQLARPRQSTTGGFTALELRESLTQAIESLPEAHRAVMVLRYWEGLSYEEIAARLKLPTTSVWRVASEASERLFGSLKPQIENDTAPADRPTGEAPTLNP